MAYVVGFRTKQIRTRRGSDEKTAGRASRRRYLYDAVTSSMTLQNNKLSFQLHLYLIRRLQVETLTAMLSAVLVCDVIAFLMSARHRLFYETFVLCLAATRLFWRVMCLICAMWPDRFHFVFLTYFIIYFTYYPLDYINFI